MSDRTMQVITFGPVAVQNAEGRTVASGVRKPLAMLAIVAAFEPAGISREQLQLLLWPDSSPERARQSVSQSLYALRQELGEAPVVGGGMLRLAPHVSSDLQRVREALARGDTDTALHLAARPFFDGVAFPGCVDLDQFVDRRRAEIDEAVNRALLQHARDGDCSTSDGVSRWLRYADRMLLDGAAVREAAQAIGAGSNRVVALRLLRRHAEAVQREMGVRVDRATQLLMDTLQDHSGEVALPPLARAPQPPSQPQPAGPVPVPAERGAAGGPERGAALDAHTMHAPTIRPVVRARGRRLGVTALVALSAAGALWLATSPRGAQSPSPPRAGSLLVAPFTYQGDSAWRYLGRGLAEEIAARLTPVPGAEVYGPGAVRVTDSGAPQQVGERLGVQYVLEGRIVAEPRGDTVEVHVTTSLVSTSDGRVVWSWTADRRLDGMLQLQTGIADSAAQRIALALSSGSRKAVLQPPTTNSQAYDFYLRAGEYLRQGRDGLPEARELLRQAVALDSAFAPALARLAETQARMNWYGYDRSAEAMREARRLIARSHDLAPLTAEPHTALAWWLLADHRAYRESSAQLDTALTFSPYNADALMTRANIARRIGQWPKSTADYREALRLDPTSYAVSLELGNTLLLMRRFDEAREALRRAQSLSPDAVDPPVWLAGLAIRERGDTAEARRVLQAAAPLVNAHALYARAALTFPELIRVLPPTMWPPVSEFSLRDAYGDTALMHTLRHTRSASETARRAHLDSAAAVLLRRLAVDPNAFAAYRALAEVRLAQGRVADALAAARRSALLMPADSDAYSAMHSQVVLAQAELRSGLRDSARTRVQRLLRIPSSLSETVVRMDPAWRELAGR